MDTADLKKLRAQRRNSRILGIAVLVLGYVIMFATIGLHSASCVIFGALVAFVGIVIFIRTFFNYKYMPLNANKNNSAKKNK